jgi:sodium-dependent dicarboxylate transporter 2/3/5
VKNFAALVSGPLVGLVVWGVTWWLLQGSPQPLADPVLACHAAAITTWCAIWWVLEPIPIPITSLLPAAALPLLGVLDQSQISGAYGHKFVLLFLGGFILSKAMERSSAHRQIALLIVRRIGGTSGKRLVLGFMLASAALSMWISNTATVLMLLPVVLAVTQQSEDQEALTVPMLLGVAYGASIGGIGTPVGTSPNLAFMAVYGQETGITWSFLDWMAIALPIVALMLPIAWLWLTRNIKQIKPLSLPDAEPWRYDQIATLVVFGLTGVAWVTRQFWAPAIGVEHTVHDSTVALAAVIVLFVLPNRRGGRLMDWETAVKIPWGILLLFGGGLAIAAAFKSSGLSDQFGLMFAGLSGMPPVLIVAVICLCVTFLTELTSNTATANVLMPILFAAATALSLPPEYLMIPAVLSCSFAFMLPVATPPNAVVFSDDHLTIRRMAKEGLVLNLIGVGVITAWCAWKLA